MTANHQVAEVSGQYLAEAAGQAVPVGYKQTEVGVIPKDWDVFPLRSMLRESPKYGINAPGLELNRNLPVYIRITDISEDGYFKPSQKVGVDSPFSYLYTLNIGDIVLARTGASVGKSYLYRDEDGRLVYAGFLIKVCPDQTKLRSDYLFQYLKTDRYWSWVTVNSMRSGQPGINGNEYGSLQVPVPPSDEQTAIANALSDVDALINELEKLVAKKQSIKTATMQQLLTGRTRLPQFALCEDGTQKGYKQSELGEIPEDWEVVRFGDIAYIRNDRVNPRVTGCGEWCVELEHINSADGTLNGSTVTSIQSSLKNKFSQGDVLFGKLRSYLRKYWLADRTGVCSTEIWVLQPIGERAISRYVYDLVTTNSFIEAASEAYGTHMPRSDWKVIKEFSLTIPCVEEQTAIATILSDMDGEIQTLQQRLSKTRQIKQGMMQELLTGKTRLLSNKSEVGHAC